MGAATITNITFGGTGNFKSRANSVHFNKRVVRVVVAPSASYATGGDSISLANIGLKTIDFTTLINSEGGTRSGMQIPTTAYRSLGCTVDVTDPTAPKLKVYSANNTEVAAASDNSTQRYLIEFYGSGS